MSHSELMTAVHDAITNGAGEELITDLDNIDMGMEGFVTLMLDGTRYFIGLSKFEYADDDALTEDPVYLCEIGDHVLALAFECGDFNVPQFFLDGEELEDVDFERLGFEYRSSELVVDSEPDDDGYDYDRYY